MHKHNPKKYFMILSVTLIVVLAFILFYFAEIKIQYAWLVSINLITLLFYGYDKKRAKNNVARMPEIVLHLLALMGGSPCALAGQLLFRHKIRKWKFLAVFIIIVILQAIILFYWISRR